MCYITKFPIWYGFIYSATYKLTAVKHYLKISLIRPQAHDLVISVNACLNVRKSKDVFMDIVTDLISFI